MFFRKLYSKLAYSYQLLVKVAILQAQSKDPTLFTQSRTLSKKHKKKDPVQSNSKKRYKRNSHLCSIEENTVDILDDFFELETLLQVKNRHINFAKVLSLVDEHYGGNLCLVKMNEVDMKVNVSGTPHEYRPFVSLEEKEHQSSGFYMTSNLENSQFWQKSFSKYKMILSEKKYDLRKPSLVLLNEMVHLDRSNIIKYIDFLDDTDFVRILKMAVLYRGSSLDLEGRYLSLGDIVDAQQNKYLIYNQDQDFSYGFKIKFCDTEEKSKVDVSQDFYYFSLDHNIYRIYYNRNIQFSDLDHVILREHMGNDDFMFIEKKRDEYFQKMKKR